MKSKMIVGVVVLACAVAANGTLLTEDFGEYGWRPEWLGGDALPVGT